MRSLRLVFSLVSIFSLAPKEAPPEGFRSGTLCFPLAGDALGRPLSLLALLPLPVGLLAALLLACLLLLTGFLHLDGLLDAADALLGSRPRAERLRILKDPHLGPFAFGVGGLHLLLLWQALALVRDPLFLLFLPGFARFAILPFLNRYPLLHQGMAGLIRGGPVWGAFLLALPFL
ncbi:adenosylcobinamide-GDP ribazoletransferase, partial [Thermus scotoductus]|uniref:adenosylcobinamide-GDP ribazoletransferase n=1 Tax=Thermus scotoductus TaxID=37636 RepID=UPI000F7F4172